MSEQTQRALPTVLNPFLQESDNEKIDLPNGGRGLLGMYCGDRVHARTGDDNCA